MYFLLISFTLFISINSENEKIPEKWELNDIWDFTYKDISKRERTSYGIVDPNGYISNEKLKELKEYLDMLNAKKKMNIFIIIIKQFKEKFVCEKFLNNLSIQLFLYLQGSKFDINNDNLMFAIYSVEDKTYKIAVGNNYKNKINNQILSEINNTIKPCLNEKETFLGIKKIITNFENIPNLPTINLQENNKKNNIKYNDFSGIFSLLIIIIVLTTLLFLFVLIFFKMRRRLKVLYIRNIDYNIMNSQYENLNK